MQNIQLKISESLQQEELDAILLFLHKTDYISHYNHPLWSDIVEPFKKPLYAKMYHNDALSGFAIIYTQLSFGIIKFGPVVEDSIMIDEFMTSLAHNLKKMNFGLLTVQLPPVDTILAQKILEQTANKKEINGWNTLIINIQNTTSEDILRSFSKGHKSAIKKAYKEGITTKIIDSKVDINQFSEMYDTMHERKGLILPLKDSKIAFNKIFDQHLGKIIGVFLDDTLIGGVVCVSEGKQLLYKFGASDANYYKIPVLHVGIFEMIKYGIDTAHEQIDLGGFVPDAKSDSYAYGINTFKKGFGGELIAYPSPFSIRLNTARYLFLKLMFFINHSIPDPVKKILHKLKN